MTRADGPEADAFIGPTPQETLYLDQLGSQAEADPIASSFPQAESATREAAAMAAGAETAEVEAPTVRPVDTLINQDSSVTEIRPETTVDGDELSPHILEAARRAVDTLLATTARREVMVGRIVHFAFGEEIVSRREFRDFIGSVNKDPRLQYRGKGCYLINGRETTDIAEGQQNSNLKTRADSQHIAMLADYAVLTMSRDRVGPEGLRSRSILGIISANGDHLRGSEVQEFYARIASHPNVKPLEDGNYALKPDIEFTPQTEGFMESRYAQEPGTNGQPMTPQQLLHKIRDLNHSPDFKRAQETAARLTKPKRRRSKQKTGSTTFFGGQSPKKTVQGRSHGKKIKY